MKTFHRSFPVLVALCMALSSWSISAQTKKWVGTWSTGVQLVESSNTPPSPGLTNNTLRQVVCVSIGGDTLRVKFSNDFSTSACTINSATLAVSTGKSTINTSTLKQLTFNGSTSITMNADSAVISDPIAFNLTPRMKLAITIYFGQTSSTVTGHPGSRTTSYLVTGKQDTAAAFSVIDTVSHWYALSTIDVWTSSPAASVAILGNSITDGRGSITDSQDRWPDLLSKRLLANSATAQVGVLNMGIGGNCVLSFSSGDLGPYGVSRYQRDILNQNGASWVIIFEGVNDIGVVTTAAEATLVADSLINAYKQMIAGAHAQNMKVYGATIMPFNGNSYYNQYSESCRSTVNQWIRTGGFYDSIIDFDKITRSATDSTKLKFASFQNDGLHPSESGYQLMADSVHLDLFTPTAVTVKDVTDKKGNVWGNIHANHANGITRVTFEIPREAFVSLKVHSILGKEIIELAGKRFSPGRHTVEFKSGNIAKGMYLFSLKADKLSASGVMIY